MARLRYWKLTAKELGGFSYPEEKLLNWDIKCIREPEEEAIFVGVFMYRDGTPIDYESVRGISFYYNNISRDELPRITKFLKDRYGGQEREKSERTILEGSKELYASSQIASLASDLESELGARATITLEFADLSEEAAKESGLPDAKLLPIPGK